MLGLTWAESGTAAGLVGGVLASPGPRAPTVGFRWIRRCTRFPSFRFIRMGRMRLWIAAAALLISAASTLVPARSAARIQPIEILRYE
jgi:ABC-type lipoprotein release transport system permease subunit